MRLLVVHPGGLGDVLLAVPAIRGLRRLHRVSEVGLLSSRQIGQFLWQCREIDDQFAFESGEFPNVLAQSHDGASSRLLSWLQGCDRAVCWMADRDGKLATALRSHGVRQTIIGSVLTGVFRGHHQSERFAEAGDLPGLQAEDVRPLSLTDEMRQTGSAVLRQIGLPSDQSYAVMHPGSGGSYKCSDPAVLARNLQWIEKNGLLPVIIEGPADQIQVARLRAMAAMPVWIVSHAELSAVASIIQAAKLYVGHDSGITHLAAALGVPTAACFGPTDESRWGPRGPLVQVIRGATCHCGSWEQAKRCVERPCLNIDPLTLARACSVLIDTALPQQ